MFILSQNSIHVNAELENNRNGIDFFRYLQKRVIPYLPVICGYLYNVNVEKVFEIEPDGYLIKPITLNHLKLCLQRLSKRIKRDKVLVSVKNGFESFLTDEILFIENNMRHAKYQKDNIEEFFVDSYFISFIFTVK